MLLRESLEEIDDFRVKRCSKFEFGPPSADTILRVFRNVNADKIEKVFIKWAHGIYEKVKYEGVSVFHEFVRIPIRLIEPDIPNSIVIAGEADSYAYDCYYLNIASQMVLPLFTYDDKMKKTAEKRGIKCL